MKKIIIISVFLLGYMTSYILIFTKKYSARPCFFNEHPVGINWTEQLIKDEKTGIVFGSF